MFDAGRVYAFRIGRILCLEMSERAHRKPGGKGGTEFLAHFGLGDATQADLVRIEWPSGIVHELTNVASKQVLTVTESPRLQAPGVGRIRVQCWKGQTFELEASNDLAAWISLGTHTNETGTLEVTDPDAGSNAHRYYRAKGK